MRKTYLYLICTIICLTVVNQVIIQYLLHIKQNDSALINLAGRQRMLSQRLNLQIYQLADSNSTGSDWKETLVQLNEGYSKILEASINSPIDRNKTEEIRQQLKLNFRKIEAVEQKMIQYSSLEEIATKDLAEINSLLNAFLSDMERIVADLQFVANRKLSFIVWVEISLALITVLITIIEIKMVVMPTFNKREKDRERIKNFASMLQALYDSSTDAITFLKPDFTISFNNKLAQAVTQKFFGKAAAVGDSILDYVLPELHQQFLESYQHVLNGNELYFEVEKESSWWGFSLYPVYDDNKIIIGIANSVTDITSRKKSELQINSQNTALRTIAWKQSHEIRSPLTNILALANMLVSDIDASKEERRVIVTHLLTSATQLDEKIKEIVNYVDETNTDPKKVRST